MSIKDIFNAVLAFDEGMLKTKIQQEIDAGTPIETILNDGLIAAMDEVGEKFSSGELFVPEMLMAAQTMKAGLKLLKPHLGVGGRQEKRYGCHRYGERRHARHRQEPGKHDDGRSRIRGCGPGCKR